VSRRAVVLAQASSARVKPQSKRCGQLRIERSLRYFANPWTEVRDMRIGGGIIGAIIIILLLIWLL